jgi:hypothetical protein
MKDRVRTAKLFDRFRACPDCIGFLAATKPWCDASTKFATAGAIRSAVDGSPCHSTCPSPLAKSHPNCQTPPGTARSYCLTD